MSEHESEFIKEFKLAVIRGLIGFSGVIAVSLTVFYFTVTNDVNNLKNDYKTLKSEKADKAVMEVELRAINNSLIRIEDKLDLKAK
jgi:hypothetical protein